MRFRVNSLDVSYFNLDLVGHHGKQAEEPRPYHTMR